MNHKALEVASSAPAHRGPPTACRLGACLLMGSPSISQTRSRRLPAVPLLLPLGAGLASDRDVLGALVQQGCVDLKARKFADTEIKCRGGQRSCWLGMVPGSPVHQGKGHGRRAHRAQHPPEAVAESRVSAGWDRNHGSSSFCIATWLGDTKNKGPKKKGKKLEILIIT